MIQRIVLLLVVTFLPACGTRAQPPQTPAAAPQTAPAPESQTDNDYVVGPFVTAASDGQGIRTYYIVRD
jgi:hypothetical protein